MVNLDLADGSVNVGEGVSSFVGLFGQESKNNLN